MPLTTSQIDRLGERLKAAAQAGMPMTEDDRRLLEGFRSEFLPSYEEVVTRIRAIGVVPSGRPEKTPESIVAKLTREGTKLSRMQDVAGCRVLVDDRDDQDAMAAQLREQFPEHRHVDRRNDPRHGYRAVHMIVRAQGRWVEVQIRTYLQEMWAAVVEALADEPGVDLKHGVIPRAGKRYATASSASARSSPLWRSSA